MRRIIYAALENLGGTLPDPLPGELLPGTSFPRGAKQFSSSIFRRDESVEALNSFRFAGAPAIDFEEFFFIN